jgi:hypothetical protein
VVIAGGSHVSTPLADEPVELANYYDLLFLVVGSPGTSAEAMELALWSRTKDMLRVFLPEEYRQGYLARSLDERHGILCDLSYFPLADALQYGEHLPQNIVHTVFKHRCALEQKQSIQSPQPTSTTNININNLMGDVINAGAGATIVNRSAVSNAFNALIARNNQATAEALKSVSDHVAKSGNKEAGELMDAFNEEVAKANPKKSVLKGLWDRVCQVLPTVTELVKASGEIVKFFSGSAQ